MTPLPIPLLVAFSIVGPITIHMILPALRDLQAEFGTDYATAQLLISLFVLAFGGGQLLVGLLADLFGKRRVMIVGMLLFTVASGLCAMAPDIGTLIALRVVQGVGACTGVVLARAMIRDRYEASASTRILGYLAIGVSIGPIIAPTAGGLLFEAGGWRAPFWSLGVLGLVNTALALRLLPPDDGAATGGGLAALRADIWLLLRHRGFILNWLSVCFNAGAAFTFIACAALVAEVFLSLSPTAFGLWFGTGALGYILGNLIAGRLAGRLPGAVVLALGAGVVGVLTALLLAGLAFEIRSPFMLFRLFAGIMAASGLVMRNAYSGAMEAVPGAVGSASGFVGFAQFAMGAVFSTAGFSWYRHAGCGTLRNYRSARDS